MKTCQLFKKSVFISKQLLNSKLASAIIGIPTLCPHGPVFRKSREVFGPDKTSQLSNCNPHIFKELIF